MRFRLVAWIGDNWLVSVTFYLLFICTSGTYVINRIRYAGVEDWPSVGASILREKGEEFRIQGQGSRGLTTSIVDTRTVQFEYSVAGRKYTGIRISPDGGSGYSNPLRQPDKAYYKPSDPAIAVLYPTGYSGSGLLAGALLCGVIVGVHLYFTLADLPPRKRL